MKPNYLRLAGLLVLAVGILLRLSGASDLYINICLVVAGILILGSLLLRLLPRSTR